MYNTLKFNHNPNQKVFWVSDLHYGHDRSFILEHRGYKTIQEHDEGIISKWNSVVTNNDVVFNLGDIIFGHDSYNRLQELLEKLNFGIMYLSGGNHTSGFKDLKNATIDGAYFVKDNRKVVLMPNLYNVSVNKQHVVNCHFPIASWDGMYHGAWHICGHEHGHYANSRPEHREGKILDVGIELFGRPIDFDEVKVVMNSKAQTSVGHH
jgi:calcineurin-like phosphoesterase family protein